MNPAPPVTRIRFLKVSKLLHSAIYDDKYVALTQGWPSLFDWPDGVYTSKFAKRNHLNVIESQLATFS